MTTMLERPAEVQDKGKLEITFPGAEGKVTKTFDKNSVQEMAEAKELFAEKTGTARMLADDGDVAVRDFPEEATKVRLTPQPQGG